MVNNLCAKPLNIYVEWRTIIHLLKKEIQLSLTYNEIFGMFFSKKNCILITNTRLGSPEKSYWRSIYLNILLLNYSLILVKSLKKIHWKTLSVLYDCISIFLFFNKRVASLKYFSINTGSKFVTSTLALILLPDVCFS